MAIPVNNRTVSFESFLDTAQKALRTGPSGGKSVIKLDGSGVKTHKWQTLGSRTDDFKTQNLAARNMLLQALKTKYEVSDVYRLPKPVLDTLQLSDFDLDSNGRVCSQRPLTARRIIAIHAAMESFKQTPAGEENDRISSFVNTIKSKNYTQLTPQDDPHLKQLIDIQVSPPEGPILVIYKRTDGGFKFRTSQAGPSGICISGDEARSTRQDLRCGARLALFQVLAEACGGNDDRDPTFMEDAIRALNLDSRNPVYEDLPLDVARRLIGRAFAIRDRRQDLIAGNYEVAVKDVNVISEAEHDWNVEKNTVFLNTHLGDVVTGLTEFKRWLDDTISKKSMPAGEGIDADELEGAALDRYLRDHEKVQGEYDEIKPEVYLKRYTDFRDKLNTAITNLKKDQKQLNDRLKQFSPSETYRRITKVLDHVGHAYIFNKLSEMSKVEFLCWVVEGREKKYTESVDYLNSDGSARQPSGYEVEREFLKLFRFDKYQLKKDPVPNVAQVPVNAQ